MSIMTFLDKINLDLKEALKAREEARLRGLRAIKAALLLAQTEKGGPKELSDEAAMKLLQKLVKQRQESLDIYREQNRPELAQKEAEEIEVIQAYLPKQLGADELEAVVKRIVADTGATSVKDMGKVMAAANKELAGKADGRAISEVVKRLLNG
jgi:uncharacterized protein